MMGFAALLIVAWYGGKQRNRTKDETINPGAIEIASDVAEALNSEKEDVQLEAARAIASDPGKYASRSKEIASAFRKSPFPKVRVVLAGALGKMAGEGVHALKALEDALASDHHHLVRLEAAKALHAAHAGQKTPAESTVRAAAFAVADEDEEVALVAMRFLFEHPSELGTKPLLRYLARKDAKYRWKAVEALGRCKDPASAPALMALLADDSEDPALRARACGVLGLLKHPPAEPLIRALAESQPGTDLGRTALETLKLFRE